MPHGLKFNLSCRKLAAQYGPNGRLSSTFSFFNFYLIKAWCTSNLISDLAARIDEFSKHNFILETCGSKSENESVVNSCVYIRILAPWNLSCFEFKFDDTRLSSQCKNKIGPIEIFVCFILTLLSLCPVGCLSLAFQNWDLATSGGNKKNQSTRPKLTQFRALDLPFHGVCKDYYCHFRLTENY